MLNKLTAKKACPQSLFAFVQSVQLFNTQARTLSVKRSDHLVSINKPNTKIIKKYINLKNKSPH
jgi:hypothetical protein